LAPPQAVELLQAALLPLAARVAPALGQEAVLRVVAKGLPAALAQELPRPQRAAVVLPRREELPALVATMALAAVPQRAERAWLGPVEAVPLEVAPLPALALVARVVRAELQGAEPARLGPVEAVPLEVAPLPALPLVARVVRVVLQGAEPLRPEQAAVLPPQRAALPSALALPAASARAGAEVS
jgi:hypothetical protein